MHHADITHEDDCARLVRAAVEAFGRVDVLHNNVGIGAGDRSATSLDEAVWQRIIDTNLKGMWLTCKHALPVMREQASGSIVNISSSVCASTILILPVAQAAIVLPSGENSTFHTPSPLSAPLSTLRHASF